jgi:hypothetical protein
MILVNVIKDHLKVLLDTFNDIDIYFSNAGIHREKEIFILINTNRLNYEVWRLRFDKRLKLNWELKKVKRFRVPNLKDNVVGDTMKSFNDPILNKIDEDQNLILCIPHELFEPEILAKTVSFSIIFSRMVVKEINFKPSILFELQEVLDSEKILPFIMKYWI